MQTETVFYDPLPLSKAANTFYLLTAPSTAPYWLCLKPGAFTGITATRGNPVGVSIKDETSALQTGTLHSFKLCTGPDQQQQVLGLFPIALVTNADWEARKAAFTNAFKECINNTEYHPSSLRVLIEFTLYHAQGLHVFQMKQFLQSSCKLREEEIDSLKSQIMSKNGVPWFLGLADRLRKDAPGSLCWLMRIRLTSYEPEKTKQPYRFFHFLSDEEAKQLLEDDAIPLGSFILRPSFDLGAGHVSASFKATNASTNARFEIRQGSFDSPSRIREVLQKDEGLQFGVTAAPQRQVFKKSKLIKQDHRHPPPNTKDYHHVFQQTQRPPSSLTSSVPPSLTTTVLMPQSSVQDDDWLEFTYREKGQDVFRQLLVQKRDLCVETLKSAIEQQENAENEGLGVRVVVKSIVELRAEKRVIINRNYRWTSNSSTELEVEFGVMNTSMGQTQGIETKDTNQNQVLGSNTLSRCDWQIVQYPSIQTREPESEEMSEAKGEDDRGRKRKRDQFEGEVGEGQLTTQNTAQQQDEAKDEEADFEMGEGDVLDFDINTLI